MISPCAKLSNCPLHTRSKHSLSESLLNARSTLLPRASSMAQQQPGEVQHTTTSTALYGRLPPMSTTSFAASVISLQDTTIDELDMSYLNDLVSATAQDTVPYSKSAIKNTSVPPCVPHRHQQVSHCRSESAASSQGTLRPTPTNGERSTVEPPAWSRKGR